MTRFKRDYTTGEVAKVAGVSPRTVSKWVDSGELDGYRLPGGQDRRIPRDNLVRFLREHKMSLAKLGSVGRQRILLVGVDTAFRQRWDTLMPNNAERLTETASNSFEAGLHAANLRPQTILIDLSLGRAEALALARHLRQTPGYRQALLIALAGEDEGKLSEIRESGFNEVFSKPFDAALLAVRIAQQFRGD